MATLREQLMDELMEVGQEDLANTIGSLESDVEAANYIAANKGYFAKKYTSDDLQVMPVFRKALYSDLKTGKVDYDEEFGEDWYKNFSNIPLDQIKFVAEKQGVDWKDLNKKMSEVATERTRYDIAHGEDAGGWFESPTAFAHNLGGAFMHTFAPRVQESIARGEEPSATDYTLDQAQNLLYAIPYGTTVRAINNPGARTLIGAALSNAGAPIATEALDATYYTDPNNPRSKFSGMDVATGTGTNLVGGALLRGAGMGIGRVAPKAREFLGELATGKTAKEVADEAASKYATSLDKAASPNVSQDVRKVAQEMKQLSETNPDLYSFAAGKNAPAWEIAAQEGNTAEEKVLNWLKSKGYTGYNYVTPGGAVISDYSANLAKANKYTPIKDSPITQEMLTNYDKLGIGTLTEGLKTADQLAKEEALKNFVTNEYGNAMYEQGRALNRLPLVGPAIQKMLEEDAKKKAEHDENMRILDELRARGLLHSER